MNINVGKKYQGWPILDAATFNAKVVATMRNTQLSMGGVTLAGSAGVPYSGAAGLGLPMRDPKAGFGIWNYTVPNDYPLDYASGASYSEDYIAMAVSSQYDSLNAKLDNPNTVFYYQDADPAGKDPNKERVQVFYYRIKDIVVPLTSRTYYSSSGWVDARTGLIFVGGVVFSAIGAPVLSSALASAANGVAIDATVGATASSTISTVANTEAQLFGDKNIALAGKAINLLNGQAGFGNLAQSAAPTGVTPMFEDLDLTDSYSNPFDGFNFSSGEADVAWSDAQVNDYGLGPFGGQMDDPQYITGLAPNTDDFGLDTTNPFAYNATPEVTTNDFGTTFEGNDDGSTNWGNEASHAPLAQGVPLAVAAATTKGNSNPIGQGASAGGSGAKAVATNSGTGSDIVGTFGSFLSSGVKAIGQVAQVTSTQPKTYSGQLAPGGVQIGGLSQQSLILVGGALVVLALVLHMKG